MLTDHTRESHTGGDGTAANPQSHRDQVTEPSSPSRENPGSRQGAGRTKTTQRHCFCRNLRSACTRNCLLENENAPQATFEEQAGQPAGPTAPDEQPNPAGQHAASPSPSPLRDISLDEIDIGYSAGVERERSVLAMMASISERGMINPITVCRIAANEVRTDLKNYRTIAGRIRGEATRRMGMPIIACIVVEASDLELEMIAIDENLIRTTQSPAEEALLLGRRKEIHEALSGPAKAKGAHAANAKMGNSFDANAKMADAFTTVAARVLDRSERQVQRIVERASLGADDLTRIAGTSLDSGTEIDQLLKLPPEERARLIDRAAAGESVSAAPTTTPVTVSSAPADPSPDISGDNPSVEAGESVETVSEEIKMSPDKPLILSADVRPDQTHDGARALMDAWHAASEPDRMAFLAWVTAAASSTSAPA
jgi:hypothetical protein